MEKDGYLCWILFIILRISLLVVSQESRMNISTRCWINSQVEHVQRREELRNVNIPFCYIGVTMVWQCQHTILLHGRWQRNFLHCLIREGDNGIFYRIMMEEKRKFFFHKVKNERNYERTVFCLAWGKKNPGAQNFII